tara:strand:+ start:1871 stop:2413 length:543 start_codon:yes stop_codon:yes gene_type:complete
MKEISEISSMFPITLNRISLSSFEQKDISEEYISWLNDPEVVKYSNQRFKTHNRETSRLYLDSFLNSCNIFLAITDNNSKSMIGTMTVYFSKNHKTADIGIMIGKREFWGKGIGEEAWLAVMELLLKKTDIRKITGGTVSCNKGMIRIFQKVGMIQDGVRKDHEIIDNKVHDIIYFAKFK